MARFQAGLSGNPHGKPKGANRSQKLRAQLMRDVPDILTAMVDQAKAGDVQAARLILDRTLPALRPEARPPAAPVPTDPAAILSAVAGSAMTPEQAGEVMNLLLAQAKIQETTEVMSRLEAAERALMTFTTW